MDGLNFCGTLLGRLRNFAAGCLARRLVVGSKIRLRMYFLHSFRCITLWFGALPSFGRVWRDLGLRVTLRSLLRINCSLLFEAPWRISVFRRPVSFQFAFRRSRVQPCLGFNWFFPLLLRNHAVLSFVGCRSSPFLPIAVLLESLLPELFQAPLLPSFAVLASLGPLSHGRSTSPLPS